MSFFKPRGLGRLAASFLLVITVSGTALGATELPAPVVETLPNGLKVAWLTSDRLPMMDLLLLVRAGSRDDPSGKSGVAQLASDLLDRGAGGLTAPQMAKQVEELGASRYVAADLDSTVIGMHGLAPDAPALLELLRKMALEPTFAEAEVLRERARALDQWARLPDHAESLATLAFQRLLTAGTVYGRGTVLTRKELAGVGREDLVRFHQAHFVPGNSILMIVGRADRKEFGARVAAAFGGWKPAAAPEATTKPESAPVKTYADARLASYAPGSVLLVHRPGLTQASVRIGFRAPLANSPDHYPLVVANALLGEYFNSRLNALIRDKLGLTYGIGSSLSYNRDQGSFAISSSTRNETAGQLIRKTIETLQTLVKGPIAVEEVRTAKEFLEGGFPLGTATLEAVASRWLRGIVLERGPGYLNEFVPKVLEVTPERVMAAVRAHFDLKNLVIVVSGDARELEAPLKASKLKVKRIAAEELL